MSPNTAPTAATPAISPVPTVSMKAQIIVTDRSTTINRIRTKADARPLSQTASCLMRSRLSTAKTPGPLTATVAPASEPPPLDRCLAASKPVRIAAMAAA